MDAVAGTKTQAKSAASARWKKASLQTSMQLGVAGAAAATPPPVPKPESVLSDSLEFDSAELAIGDFQGERLRPVIYARNALPSLSVADMAPECLEDAVTARLTRKRIEWAHEKEWRFITGEVGPKHYLDDALRRRWRFRARTRARARTKAGTRPGRRTTARGSRERTSGAVETTGRLEFEPVRFRNESLGRWRRRTRRAVRDVVIVGWW